MPCVADGEVAIRQGTIEDYPSARAVLAETLAFHRAGAPEFFQETDAPPPSQEAIAELLQGGDGAWLLAEDAGAVIGFVTVRVRRGPFAPYHVPEPYAVVDGLGIRAAWRRRGIGRALMEAAHAWAREQGARRMILNVWEFNGGARSLYDAMGYRTFSRNLWVALQNETEKISGAIGGAGFSLLRLNGRRLWYPAAPS
jgi:ribosomal protein S18 acetylase RimI-like enzyme